MDTIEQKKGYHRTEEADQIPEEAGSLTCRQIPGREWKVSRHAQNAARPIPYLRRRGRQKEASRCTSAMNVEGGSLRI